MPPPPALAWPRHSIHEPSPRRPAMSTINIKPLVTSGDVITLTGTPGVLSTLSAMGGNVLTTEEETTK